MTVSFIDLEAEAVEGALAGNKRCARCGRWRTSLTHIWWGYKRLRGKWRCPELEIYESECLTEANRTRAVNQMARQMLAEKFTRLPKANRRWRTVPRL